MLKTAGYSLLEILISLCILSTGLLGFAQAQLLALRNNQIANIQSIAQTRLVSLAETIQACAMVKCSTNNLSQAITHWNELNTSLLPQGQGSITQHDTYQIITLHWQARAGDYFNAQVKLLMPTLHG